MMYVSLLAGMVILLLSGDVLVRGAVALAIRLGVPALIVGLTIVAFGTSAPELVVSVSAALSGSGGLAIGNVVGSNICNLLLVLGLPAMIAPTNCDQPHMCRNTFYVVGASILFIILCFYGPLEFWHGLVLFGLIVLFLAESGWRASEYPNPADCALSSVDDLDGVSGVPHTNWLMGLFIVLGIAGLPLGAHLTVDGATQIARNFGVSEVTIGLTIVALGTSLPELATTLSAALRGHCGVALGNVLGSNLFNILAIMGITAILAPVPVPDSMLRYDLWVMLFATLAVVPFALGRRQITRIPAAAFVMAYLVYIAFVFGPEQGALATALAK